MDFNVYPLSMSTILDNRVAMYLVNIKDLLIPSLFKKANLIACVEAGTQSFLITGHDIRRIENVLNRS